MNKYVFIVMLLCSISQLANAQNTDGKPRVLHVFQSVLIDGKPQVKETIAALVNMESIMDAPHDGCDEIIGSIKVEGVQFSHSGATLESFRFTDRSGAQWSVPTNINVLPIASRQDANSFIRVGHAYFAHIQVCGSGGFASLISMYDTSMGFGQKEETNIKDHEHWKKIEYKFPITRYIDLTRTVKTGDTATIWSLQDYDASAAGIGKYTLPGFQSIKFQMEYNCKTDTSRVLYYATFSGHMGHGSVKDGGAKVEEWQSVPTGMKSDRELACR